MSQSFKCIIEISFGLRQRDIQIYTKTHSLLLDHSRTGIGGFTPLNPLL